MKTGTYGVWRTRLRAYRPHAWLHPTEKKSWRIEPKIWGVEWVHEEFRKKHNQNYDTKMALQFKLHPQGFCGVTSAESLSSVFGYRSQCLYLFFCQHHESTNKDNITTTILYLYEYYKYQIKFKDVLWYEHNADDDDDDVENFIILIIVEGPRAAIVMLMFFLWRFIKLLWMSIRTEATQLSV